LRLRCRDRAATLEDAVKPHLDALHSDMRRSTPTAGRLNHSVIRSSANGRISRSSDDAAGTGRLRFPIAGAPWPLPPRGMWSYSCARERLVTGSLNPIPTAPTERRCLEQPGDIPRLLLLGVPTLEGGGQSGAITSRRRLLALLALLATGGRAGLSRDRIYAALWPDSDTERASSSLRQAVFAIRKELGGEVLSGDSVLLRINPDALALDLWSFETLVDQKRWAEAAALYRGPFLEGLNVRGLHDLDRHFENERARLARRALQAIENVAEEATTAGRHQDAVAAWRRAVQIDPLGSRNALGLLKALVDSGERMGALEYGRVYELLVRTELDGEPDTSVVRYLTRLRRGSGQAPVVDLVTTGERQALSTVTGSRSHRLTPPGGAGATRRRATPSDGTPAADRGVAAEGEGRNGKRASGRHATQRAATALRRGWWRRPSLLVIALGSSVVISLAALALATVSGRASFASADQGEAPEMLVAVVPFHAVGDVPQNFSTTVAELLGASLHGLDGSEVIPLSAVVAADPSERGGDVERQRVAAARRLGASRIVTGTAAVSGGRLRLTAVVERTARGGVDRVTTEGPVDDLLQLIDATAREITALRMTAPADRLKRSAAQTTSSVAALRAFLLGERYLEEDRLGEAVDAFSAAVVQDSAFGLAYFRLGVAADLAARDSLAAWAVQRALFDGNRLAQIDRRRVQGYLAARDGELRKADVIYAELVEDYADDVHAALELAQLQFAMAPVQGRSISVARPAFERVTALDPSNVEALIHLARIAAIEGQRERADSLVQRVSHLRRTTRSLELRALRAFALNDGSGRKRVTRSLLAGSDQGGAASRLLQIAARSSDVDGVEDFARGMAASEMPELRGFGQRLLGQMALARGRWGEAHRLYRLAMLDTPVPAIEQLAVLASLPFSPASGAELGSIRTSLVNWDAASAESEPIHNHAHRGLHAAIRSHRLGLIEAKMGDTASLALRLQELRRLPATAPRQQRLASTLAYSIAARLEEARGRTEVALILLDSASWQDAGNVFESEAADRFMRARLLEQLGRRDEAIRWYAAMSQRAAYELVYLAPSQLRLAALQAERREVENARRSAQLALTLWRDPDPQLRPLVEQARRIGRR
jgi:DNA-binding SARP family transcriptional activator/tetratricopeptide (TPR) repeat protein